MIPDFLTELRGNRFNPEYLPGFESRLFFEGEGRSRQVVNFAILLALSTVIATYGVVTDSTAAVIGAMIVAPLMTPIMASAAAATLGSTRRLSEAIQLVLYGVAGVIVLSILLTVIVPGPMISFSTNSQIISRVSPGLFDLMIALAAGAAGAYAMGRQEIADSLAGVAIAISLVPPLCVTGISLAKGEWLDSGGAFLLFLTNFFAILLAGAIVFRLMGLERFGVVATNQQIQQKAIRIIITGTILITLLLAFTTYNAVLATNEQAGTAQAVKGWIGDAAFEIIGVRVQPSQVDIIQPPEVDITIRGDGQVPPLTDLYARLNVVYGHPAKINLHVIPYQSQSYPR